MIELEGNAKALHDEIRASLQPRTLPRTTIVTILSIGDDSAAQWIVGDPEQDPYLVAKRLRCCADTLERRASHSRSLNEVPA